MRARVRLDGLAAAPSAARVPAASRSFKRRRLFTHSVLCFTMKSNPPSCSATPFARCLGLLAVCFFTFAVASDAKADLTYDQTSFDDPVSLDEETLNAVSNLAVRMSAASSVSLEDNVTAILNVLLNWREGVNSRWVRSLPFVGGDPSSSTVGSLLRHSFGEDWTGNSVLAYDPDTGYLREIQRALYGQAGYPNSDDSIVATLLRLESTTTNFLSSWGYANGDTLHSQMDLIEDYVHALRLSVPTMESRLDSHGVELLVAAPDLEDGLDTLDNDLRTYLTYVLDELSGVELSLDDLAQTIIAYWSESPASTESAAESAAEDEMEDEDADATAEFESIDLPDADEDDYEPAYTEGTVPDATLGLDDVESPVSHNALIRLVRGSAFRSGGNDLPISSSGLPDIEIDFGRDSALVSGMSRFASWTEWLYGSLFALLFSVKGVNMWRMVRVAYLAAGVGENPIVHLAWDPI